MLEEVFLHHSFPKESFHRQVVLKCEGHWEFGVRVLIDLFGLLSLDYFCVIFPYFWFTIVGALSCNVYLSHFAWLHVVCLTHFAMFHHGRRRYYFDKNVPLLLMVVVFSLKKRC